MKVPKFCYLKDALGCVDQFGSVTDLKVFICLAPAGLNDYVTASSYVVFELFSCLQPSSSPVASLYYPPPSRLHPHTSSLFHPSHFSVLSHPPLFGTLAPPRATRISRLPALLLWVRCEIWYCRFGSWPQLFFAQALLVIDGLPRSVSDVAGLVTSNADPSR